MTITKLDSQPPVLSGESHSIIALSFSMPAPAKRSSSDSGIRSVETGGMNRPRSLLHSLLAMKAVCHQLDQRRTVRGGGAWIAAGPGS